FTLFFFFSCYHPHTDLNSFPTRRSSDLSFDVRKNDNAGAMKVVCSLILRNKLVVNEKAVGMNHHPAVACKVFAFAGNENAKTLQDRKSTRLNSSHVAISYAVFCLKKKKK